MTNFDHLALRLDTSTLVSFVATLCWPQSGGELPVLRRTSTTWRCRACPTAFSYDQPAVEAQYEHVRLDTRTGRLFLLQAAGRRLHRVGRIVGPRAYHDGGFLMLDCARENVLYWS